MEPRQPPIKVCIAGALGKVGRAIVEGCLLRPGAFATVSVVARQYIGEDLGIVFGRQALGITITDRIGEALAAKPDVFIDYTGPESVKGNVLSALEFKIPCVIGATGLSEPDLSEIEAVTQRAGVAAISANFSFGAALLQRFSKIACRTIPDYEILEFASHLKPDVPSGTARDLAHHLGRIRAAPAQRAAPVTGILEARGAEMAGSRVHSVRLPGSANAVEVRFGLPGETLTIRHEEADPRVFVAGTLKAAQIIRTAQGLIRGLDEILFPAEA